MNQREPTAADEPKQDKEKLEVDLVDEIREEFAMVDPGAPIADDAVNQAHRYIRLRARYAAEIERLKAQQTAMMNEAQRRLTSLDWMFADQTRETVRRMLEGGKAKSIRTPWGTAGFRKLNDRLLVNDATLVIAAVENGNLPGNVERVTTSINKSALDDHFTNTGEVPDGCAVQPGCDKFWVK